MEFTALLSLFLLLFGLVRSKVTAGNLLTGLCIAIINLPIQHLLAEGVCGFPGLPHGGLVEGGEGGVYTAGAVALYSCQGWLTDNLTVPSHPSEQRYKTTISEFFMIETRGGRLLVRSSATRLAESWQGATRGDVEMTGAGPTHFRSAVSGQTIFHPLLSFSCCV